MAAAETSAMGRHRFATSYLHGGYGRDQDCDVIMLDHCYSKPWSAHPDATNARPMRTLFMDKFPRNTNQEHTNVGPDADIDVTGLPPALPLLYDAAKARSQMTECERHVSFSHPEETEDLEERISRVGWTVQQNRLFNKVMKALYTDRLVRLAYEGNTNEPILRRIHIDKTAKRIRQALASVCWDTKLAQWLHGMLLDNLSLPLMAVYFDVLQTLKAKIPSLVDKIIAGSVSSRSSAVTPEALSHLLKRPWDPVQNTLSQQKPKRLPGNPLLLIAPNGPTHPSSSLSKRTKFWNAQLSSLGKVIPVTMHTVNGGSGVGIAQCLEHMIGAVRTKVLELKSHFQNRPIILLGWNVGALVACHVSLVEIVTAVVCLGFPFTGISGGRGDLDDPLLESKTPTLFVIGQHGSCCSIDDIEDLREKMKAENGLLVVGGADDHLRVTRAKKKQEALTQIMADRCILDEVCEFLGGILSQSATEQIDMSDLEIRQKKKRRIPKDDVTLETPAYTGKSARGGVRYRRGNRHASTLSTVSNVNKNHQMDESSDTSGSTDMSPSPAQHPRNRASFRKRQDRNPTTAVPRKRTAMQASVLDSASAAKAVAAVALPSSTTSTKAPELSGLLQGIKTSLPTGSTTSEATKTTTAHPHAMSTLLSSVMNSKQMDSPSGSATPASSLYVLSGKPAASSGENLEMRTSVPFSSGVVPSLGSHKHQQILVRTGTSNPITIPLSMAQKLVSGAPLVHITSAASSAAQIQHLLTSIAKPISTQVGTGGVISSVNLAASAAVSSAAQVSSSTSQPRVTPTVTTAGQLLQQKLLAASSTLKGQLSAVNQTEQEKVQAIQKLQFHDFPLTTASLSSSSGGAAITSAKILTSSELDIGKIRSLSDQCTSKDSVTISVSESDISPTTLSNVHSSTGAQSAGSQSSKGNISSAERSLSIPIDVSQLNKQKADKMTAVVTRGETLGKVSSLLKSSPITSDISRTAVSSVQSVEAATPVTKTTDSSVSSPGTQTSTVTLFTPGRTSKTSGTTSSYSTLSKPILPTIASTRTRRIKTPKQYDL